MIILKIIFSLCSFVLLIKKKTRGKCIDDLQSVWKKNEEAEKVDVMHACFSFNVESEAAIYMYTYI